MADNTDLAASRHGDGDGGPAISERKSIDVLEARNHLIEALTELFNKQKVRTFNSLVRDLWDLVKKLSTLPESCDRNKHLIEGALCGVSASQTELVSVVKHVAVHVHGVYVMKPPRHDHLRYAFILLFLKAEPTGVLRKQEIMQRGKEILKRDINESEYAQVVDDICITTEDGGLMLKNGDGGPAISASKFIYVAETQNHLIGALNKIFDEQKVRTIRSVVSDLRDLVKRLSALPRSSDRNKHLIKGALCGLSASLTELASVLKQVSVHVHGVYIMKPPKLEHLRNVFILLFSEAKPNAVLRKQEIMQRGRELFKREINESEYVQVVDDICITTEDGGLMLNDGD